MAGIFTVGQSAISAAQVAVNTVGQNIANVSTPGYSRQSVVQASSAGYGTEVVGVQRSYSDFLGTQVLATQSSTSQLSAQYTQMSQVNDLIADSSAGLAPALQDFFNGLQTVAARPSDAAPRQTLLSSAQTLASRFNAIEGRLSKISSSANQQIETSVQNINVAAEQLVTLNESIRRLGDKTPNELKDQREQLLRDLSKEVKISVTTDQKGQYNVLMGSGMPLVVDGKAYPLTVKAPVTEGDPSTIVANFGNGDMTMTAKQLVGGAIGGLMEFRDNSLVSVRTQLDQIAQAFADGMNSQQTKGYRADGTAGQAMFTINADQPAASIAVNLSGIADIAAAGALSANGKPLSGDNQNAQKMIDFQNTKVLNKQSSTVSDAYAQLVGQVGSKTRELELTSTSADSIHSRAMSAVDQLSGVNLDEEAANLIRYQQAYQAAGKLVQVANQMFGDILNINN